LQLALAEMVEYSGLKPIASCSFNLPFQLKQEAIHNIPKVFN